MRQRLLTLAVLVFALVGLPRAASAGFWAWLEEWSGPGPFRGKPIPILFSTCLQETRDEQNLLQAHLRFRPSPIAMNNRFHQDLQDFAEHIATTTDKRAALRRLLANPELANGPDRKQLLEYLQYRKPAPQQPPPQQTREVASPTPPAPPSPPPLLEDRFTDFGPGHSDKRMVCFYVDHARYTAEAQRGFPAVAANVLDIGPVARLHDGLDIGGGFGRMSFTGQLVNGTRFEGSRTTLTPIRVVFRPILVAVPEEWRKRWMGVFTIFWKETFVMGELNGEHFGLPREQFRVDGELLRSYGVNIDLLALIPARFW
jgi:hypothetical protein